MENNYFKNLFIFLFLSVTLAISQNAFSVNLNVNGIDLDYDGANGLYAPGPTTNGYNSWQRINGGHTYNIYAKPFTDGGTDWYWNIDIDDYDDASVLFYSNQLSSTPTSSPDDPSVTGWSPQSGVTTSTSVSVLEETPYPEISLTGNGHSITSGDNTPSTYDFTEFVYAEITSGSTTRTYTISNIGGADLSIGTITLSGTNASDFSVTSSPSSTITVSSTSNFTVTFNPSGEGIRTAILSIPNNDSDESPFIFTIKGEGFVEEDLSVDGITNPITAKGSYEFQGYMFGYPYWKHSSVEYYIYNDDYSGRYWNIDINLVDDENANGDPDDDDLLFFESSTAATPKGITGWTASGSYTGSPVITAAVASPEIDILGNSTSIVSGDVTSSFSDYTHFGSLNTSSGTRSRTFTIQNTGAATLSLSGSSPYISISGSAAADFSITGVPSNSITAGNTTTFTVTFDASTDGDADATLTISSNDSNESSYSFSIRGSGFTPENIELSGVTDPNTANGVYIHQGILNEFQYWSYTNGSDTYYIYNDEYDDQRFWNIDRNLIDDDGVLGEDSDDDFLFLSGSTAVTPVTISSWGNNTASGHETSGTPVFGSREIYVNGNSQSIVDGDATPSSFDHTDFGSVSVASGTIVRTFTIGNSGDLTLNISGVAISGAASSDFTVTTAPSSTVTGGSTTTFQVTFDPSGSGTRSATISIANDDNDENPYNFSIQGTGLNNAPVLDDSESPVLSSIDEDVADGSNGGTTIASIVVDGSITDPDGLAVEAIVVTSVNNTNGNWQYSLDNGTSWNNFSVTNGSSVDISSAARLLDGSLTGPNTHLIRFQPGSNYNGTSTITFEAWDRSAGTAGGTLDASGAGGGTTAFSTANDEATITVNVVNDAPTLTAFSGVVETTIQNTEIEISFAELIAKGNQLDVDGTVDAFIVKALSTGTLNIGTSTGTATPFAVTTNDAITASNNAYWTPATDAYGTTINAFTTTVQDNLGAESTGAVQATVQVNDVTDPQVSSITSSSPANATSVTFVVAFTESVVNVSTDDFTITSTGTANGSIASVSASSGTSINVTVNTITGTGTLRLDLDGTTNIADASANTPPAAYSSGSVHSVDLDGPTLDSSTPNDEVIGVDAASNITLTFNENIVFGTGNIHIIDLDDGSGTVTIDVASPGVQASISTGILTLNPSSDLEEYTNYAIQIASTAIDDVYGNSYAGILNNTTLNFMVADVTAPTLVSSIPSDNGTNATLSGDIVLTFDDNMALGTSGYITIKNLIDDTNFEQIPYNDSKISFSGTQVTIDPSGTLLKGVGYYLEIDATALVDDAANPFAGISGNSTLNFTAVDVVINEVVTDPQIDWSTTLFDGTNGLGVIDVEDQWLELFVKSEGIDFTGWTIELLDGSDVFGDLTNAGAFIVSRYISTSTGLFTNSVSGDYLVLGNVNGIETMDNMGLTIRLKDPGGAIVDVVEIGGSTGQAPIGLANNIYNESVQRFTNGLDTDNDVSDFTKGKATLGAANTGPSVTLSASSATVAEAAGTSILTATLSAECSQEVTVTIGSNISSTATSVSDYSLAATVVIAAGDLTGTTILTAVQDTKDETDETAIIDITGVINGTEVGIQQQTITITDDDDEPTVTLSQSVSTFVENEGVNTITATLSIESGKDVTVYLAYSGTANGDDYTAANSITVIAGSLSGSTTITGVIDALSEIDETIIAEISSVTNGDGFGIQSVTSTITDFVPAYNVSITRADNPISCGETIEWTITVNNNSGYNLPIIWVESTMDGAYTYSSSLGDGIYSGDNGTNIGQVVRWELSNLINGASAELKLSAIADNQPCSPDLDNTVSARWGLGAADGSSATKPGVDSPDDGLSLSTTSESDTRTETRQPLLAIQPLFSANEFTVIITNYGPVDASDMDFTVTLPAGLTYSTGSSTGMLGTDDSGVMGSISDPSISGNTLTFYDTVDKGSNVADDLQADGGNDTYVLKFSVTGSAVAGINYALNYYSCCSDEQYSRSGSFPSISINDIVITEGNSGTTNATFTVSLSEVSDKIVTVNYSTTNNTALNGDDYNLSANTLTFNPGITSQSIIVQVLGDIIDEGDETFYVNLSNANHAMISDNQGIGTITDDDPTPTVAFNSVSSIGLESLSSADLQVDLSAVSGLEVTVDYVVTGTATSADYTLANGTLIINVGDPNNNITIASIVNDLLDENNETVVVTLSSPINATLGTNTVHTYTITDDDPTPTIYFNSTASNGDESVSSAALLVDLSAASGLTVTVDYIVSGTATSADYTLADGTFTINAGDPNNDITIASIVDDLLYEEDETVIVTLSNPVNASLGTNTVYTYTITDDDAMPTVTFTAASQSSVNETGSITITAKLSAVSGRDVTVPFTVNGSSTATGSGVDYSISASPIFILEGNTTVDIEITITEDNIVEDDETVIVEMGTPTNATSGVITAYTATIADDDVLPNVSTQSVTSIGSSTAIGHGNITDLGIPNPTQYGLCWNTSGMPTTSENKTEGGAATATGDFSMTIALLSPVTTYYVRAYATNETGTVYGEEVRFSTKKKSQLISFPVIAKKTYGDADFSLSVTATSGLGVTYSSSDENVATIINSMVHIENAGTCVIYANQSGNTTYYSASQVSQQLTVNKASQIITFNELPTVNKGDEPLVLNAIASSGLEVCCECSNSESAYIEDGCLVIVEADTVWVTARQEGNQNYLAAVEVEQMIIINFATGIEELTLSEPLFYPNPVTRILYLNEVCAGAKSVKLYNLSGGLVLSEPNPTLQIDCSAINRGVYLIVVDLGEGRKYTGKIIKE